MSKVYAIDMRASDKENMLKKLGRLFEALDPGQGVSARDLAAIKLHFGERGGTAFIRPIFVRQIVDRLMELGAHPFLTDANTLYVGTRTNSALHLRTAVENGFAYSVVNAPATIADGLKGSSYRAVPLDGELIKTAYIGADIADADVLVSMAHFKLHELSGVGGAIKNVGMGGASRRGKMDQHSGINPKVKAKKCVACGTCLDHCAQEAISLVDSGGEDKAFIDNDKCVGCAECIPVCPEAAIQVQWDKSIPNFMKKMVEYTAAALKGKDGKCFYINFLTDITPACDCHPSSDAALVRDIGILASRDIVAVDQASIDLFNGEAALQGCCLENNRSAGEDKIKGVYPHIDWEVQYDYAEKLGLGSRKYELEWLEKK